VSMSYEELDRASVYVVEQFRTANTLR